MKGVWLRLPTRFLIVIGLLAIVGFKYDEIYIKMEKYFELLNYSFIPTLESNIKFNTIPILVKLFCSFVAIGALIWVMFRLRQQFPTSKIGKYLTRSEALLVSATLLAAVAAVFSAVAAFQQERATFNSLLYGKEIEEISHFMNNGQRAVKVMQDYIGLSRNIMVDKRPMKEIINQLKGDTEELDKIMEQLDENMNTLISIVPNGYMKLFYKFLDSLSGEKSMWGEDVNQLNNYEKEGKQYIDNASAALFSSETAHDTIRNFSVLRSCVFSLMSEARILDEAGADYCEYKQYSDRYQ